MEIGNKLNQLRKLSGMTQEQLAQKLAVSRQTISKWESDSTSPDLESIVKISKLFHMSLDDLLLEENTDALKENDGQISLEDLTKINLHHRKTTLLLMSGLIFIMVSILNFAYVTALERTTVSTQYMLYRYIVTGQYDNAPVNYMNLMIPSVIAGVIGLALFLCCLFHNNEKKHMFQIICIISCIAACVLAISLFFYGSKNKSTDYSAIYGATIGGLEDNELFAIIETNSSSPVLLVTSQVYEDGQGHQATLLCDVYYPIDGEVKNIGSIESFGTAYPISFDKTGIYTASGHTMQCFEIDEENGTLRLAEGAYEQFDENGNASYTLEKEGKAEEITEEEYYKVFEKYSEADVVNFSYGASGT